MNDEVQIIARVLAYASQLKSEEGDAVRSQIGSTLVDICRGADKRQLPVLLRLSRLQTSTLIGVLRAFLMMVEQMPVERLNQILVESVKNGGDAPAPYASAQAALADMRATLDAMRRALHGVR